MFSFTIESSLYRLAHADITRAFDDSGKRVPSSWVLEQNKSSVIVAACWRQFSRTLNERLLYNVPEQGSP